MKNKLSIYLLMLLFIAMHSSNIKAQALTGYSFKIVNMMPNAQSNDIFFDSETNVAVNPANTNVIAGSAFTKNPTGSTTSAPIYISSDGGTTWSLNNILPSGNGMTGDVSVGFATSSGSLYAGILRGGSSFRCMMLRTNTPTTSATMTTLVDRSTVSVDQPFVVAATINDASATPRDRVYSGDNLYGSRKSAGGNGRTAEVMVSNNAGSAAPAGFSNQIINPRTAFAQDMPAIRTAVHNSGVVYAVYYRWISGGSSPFNCDVMVARDDNFASGGSPFTNLNDGGDGMAGQKVVTGRSVPAFGATAMGNNRLVASNLAVAVNPNSASNVFIGWCDRVSTSDYTLHFRRSTNSGQSWGSSDWLTITNATNPGIAVATGGKVALIYQQFTGSGSSARWETHLRTASTTGTSFTDDILSTFLDTDLSGSTISPSLGDYLEIQAVGNTFYGVFPASNRPVTSNFPHSVTFQRNADFTTNQVRNVTNTGNVAVSVDPFFFRISPRFVNICVLHPEICNFVFVDVNRFLIRIPPYPCPPCPWPCLTCPPFEIPWEEMYKQAIKDRREPTILSMPYYHLILNGYNPADFDIAVTTKTGETIWQELNKTEKGYVLSFRPSKSTFNIKGGTRGLILTVLPKNERAAKKGAEFNYRLEISDYQLKEFMEGRK